MQDPERVSAVSERRDAVAGLAGRAESSEQAGSVDGPSDVTERQARCSAGQRRACNQQPFRDLDGSFWEIKLEYCRIALGRVGGGLHRANVPPWERVSGELEA